MRINYDFKEPMEEPFTPGHIYMHVNDTKQKEPQIYLYTLVDKGLLVSLNGKEIMGPRCIKRSEWLDITHIYVLQASCP